MMNSLERLLWHGLPLFLPPAPRSPAATPLIHRHPHVPVDAGSALVREWRV